LVGPTKKKKKKKKKEFLANVFTRASSGKTAMFGFLSRSNFSTGLLQFRLAQKCCDRLIGVGGGSFNRPACSLGARGSHLVGSNCDQLLLIAVVLFSTRGLVTLLGLNCKLMHMRASCSGGRSLAITITYTADQPFWM